MAMIEKPRSSENDVRDLHEMTEQLVCAQRGVRRERFVVGILGVTMLVAALIGIISGSSILVPLTGKSRLDDIADAVKSEIYPILHEADQFAKEEQRKMVEAIDRQTARLDQITTDEISRRLGEIEGSLDGLLKQYESLNQIINPSNAEEILTVARMKDEILARTRFEDAMAKEVDSYDSRIVASEKRLDERMALTENRISAMQFWIWTQLIAIIGALAGAVVLVVRKLPKPSPIIVS